MSTSELHTRVQVYAREILYPIDAKIIVNLEISFTSFKQILVLLFNFILIKLRAKLPLAIFEYDSRRKKSFSLGQNRRNSVFAV